MIAFKKTTTIPTTWDADTLYWIKGTFNGNDMVETYVTNQAGTPYPTGNVQLTRDIAQSVFNDSYSNPLHKVSNYSSLLTLASGAIENMLVVVADTSDDTVSTPSPAGGVGLYFVDGLTGNIEFLADMDLTVSLEWSDIKNIPATLPTGATNGLTLNGSQEVELGGSLTKDTTITGTDKKFKVSTSSLAGNGSYMEVKAEGITASSGNQFGGSSTINTMPTGNTKIYGSNMNNGVNRVLVDADGVGLNVYRDVNELLEWAENQW